MARDCLAIGAELAEQERLDEAPCRGKQMEVLHRLPELERAQHVALDVDIAREIGVAKAPLAIQKTQPSVDCGANFRLRRKRRRWTRQSAACNSNQDHRKGYWR